MKIDEDKEEFDLSDHNMITTKFELKKYATKEESPGSEASYFSQYK